MRRLTPILVALLCCSFCVVLNSTFANDGDQDVTAAQVIAKRAAERAGKLEGAPWSDRAMGVISALSTDVHAYFAASKRLFSLLVPTPEDRTAARRSFRHLSEFTKKTAAGTVNGVARLRMAYKKEGVAGIRNCIENAVSAVLDHVVPVPNSSPDASTEPSTVRNGRKLLQFHDDTELQPKPNAEADPNEIFGHDNYFEHTETTNVKDEMKTTEDTMERTADKARDLASRVRHELSEVASTAEKKARDGVSAASARFNDASERIKDASMHLKNVAAENAELFKAAAGGASTRLKNVCDIKKHKLLALCLFIIFVVFFVAIFGGVLERCQRKRKPRRSPRSRKKYEPIVESSDNEDEGDDGDEGEEEVEEEEEQSEEEEEEEETEETENEDDDGEKGDWYEDGAEEDDESTEYYKHKYGGTQSITTSVGTYKSAGLPKDVKIRYAGT